MLCVENSPARLDVSAFCRAHTYVAAFSFFLKEIGSLISV